MLVARSGSRTRRRLPRGGPEEPAVPGRASFDLVVCGLALAHLAELDTPIRELARVLAPGGRLIVSVLHPFQALLGWHAPFTGSGGQRGFVREHPHLHTDYLAAFATAGLDLRACVEPEITYRQVTAKRRAFRHIPEATAEAYLACRPCLCGGPGVRLVRRRAVRATAQRVGTSAGTSAGDHRYGRAHRVPSPRGEPPLSSSRACTSASGRPPGPTRSPSAATSVSPTA